MQSKWHQAYFSVLCSVKEIFHIGFPIYLRYQISVDYIDTAVSNPSICTVTCIDLVCSSLFFRLSVHLTHSQQNTKGVQKVAVLCCVKKCWHRTWWHTVHDTRTVESMLVHAVLWQKNAPVQMCTLVIILVIHMPACVIYRLVGCVLSLCAVVPRVGV